MTSLIDRMESAATVKGLLLREDVRLLTLIGPPGVGKTRLGIQVVTDVARNAATLTNPGALLPGTAFHAYDPRQGFFALRRALEPLWSQPERPRLLHESQA